MHSKKHSISFCIICINSLGCLKDTVLKNIDANENYGEFEFILLDYNGGDETEYWVKKKLYEYVLTSSVCYYKTFELFNGDYGHAKNTAARLATGDILCFISPGQYLSNDFAVQVNNAFDTDNNIVLTATNKQVELQTDDPACLCVKRDDFFRLSGFDEQITSHKLQQYDLLNRLQIDGIRLMSMVDALITV